MSVAMKPTPKAAIADRAAAARAKATPAVAAWARVAKDHAKNVFPANGRGMRLSAVGLYRWLRQDEYIEFAREAGTVHKDADRHRARILWNLAVFGITIVRLVLL
jgi:hypothetical protein